jgi:uncharacterized protein YbjT (DUF2867 family)
VELVYGDCEDPASLDAAFDGADRAFLMSAQTTGSAEHPTHDLHLVQAAQRAGVRHVVKLSVYSGGCGHDAISAWHREAEAAVMSSGIGWTLLRPGRFMSNALGWRPMIQRGETVRVPFARRPAASIDPADVAILAEVLNRPLWLVEPSVEEAKAGMLAAGMPVPVVEAAIARVLDGKEGTELLPTVAQILGRPPASFAQWAAHAALFTSTDPQ